MIRTVVSAAESMSRDTKIIVNRLKSPQVIVTGIASHFANLLSEQRFERTRLTNLEKDNASENQLATMPLPWIA